MGRARRPPSARRADILGELPREGAERAWHLGFGGWPAPAAAAYVRMPSFDAGLPSSALSEELLGALVRHPRLPALRRLDLSGCALGDRAAPVLLEAAGALARIGAIDLSRNQLTTRFTSRLTAALPNATLGEQGRGEPDFFMRYVATME